jgi:hypothetical protein
LELWFFSACVIAGDATARPSRTRNVRVIFSL